MNILIMSWRGIGHSHAGGAEQVTFEHAKAWVNAGHKVTIFTSFFPGGKKEEISKGVRIIRRGEQFLGVKLSAFWWYLFEKKESFDLVVDEFHGVPFFSPIYVRVKKLAFIHEVAKDVWKLNPWPRPFNLLPLFLGPLLEPSVFKLFYSGISFMTVSESTKKDLIEIGIHQKNITVIQNGVIIPKSPKTFRKENKTTIIYLGALARDKGIEAAIQAFGLMKNERPDWRYWIVGHGEKKYLEKLKRMVMNLNLEKETKFWGFVSDANKFALLSRSHLLLNPSIREGWGLTIIEAASQGLPSIVYDVPGLRDSVVNGKTGIVCKEKLISSLVRAATRLMDNKKEYQNMCISAKQWSKNFTWEKSTRQSLKLLKEVTG